MQFTMVKAVPLYSAGQVCATKVENCGESATTAIPHIKYATRTTPNGAKNNSGDTKHSSPEVNNVAKATQALPYRNEAYPPTTHPTPPLAIMTKVMKLGVT